MFPESYEPDRDISRPWAEASLFFCNTNPTQEQLLTKFRRRKDSCGSSRLQEGTERIANVDDDHSLYTFLVRMKGQDRSNLRRAIDKYAEEHGFLPSNPLLLNYLVRNYVNG